MTKPIQQHSKTPAQCGPLLRITPIAVACATLLLPAGVALAQTQAPAQSADSSQTVVVTGIRHAIETSVTIKRNADSIVEAVSSEDIGKLPETSIAEALARLPGVTAQRVNGRDQVLSIRGMAEKFAVTLLNGREMVSTGDNRSVEYDQFPAELINGAVVYKTPDAALGAQGLAGTVNMKTVSPLDFAERHINMNLRTERNANGKVVPGTSSAGNRVSASYIDQFADRTVGVALGLAHLDSPNQEKFFNSWWWGNSAIWGGGFRGLENADPSKAPSTLQGFETGVLNIDNKRDGLLAVVEYKPNKDLHSQLDLYYSKFRQTSSGRDLSTDLGPDWSGDGSAGSPVAGGPLYSNTKTTLFGNFPVVTQGTVSNVDPLMTSRYNKRNDEVKALGWNTELKTGDWKSMADLSYSKATRNEVQAEAYASATTMTGFSSFNANTGSGYSQYVPMLNYGSSADMQLRGKMGWWTPTEANLAAIPPAGSLSPIEVSDEMKALRLSAKRELNFGPVVNFEGGVNFTDRSKDTARTQMLYALKNGTPCVNATDVCAPFPAGVLQSPVNLGFAGIPGLVSFDTMTALNSGAYDAYAANASAAPGRSWGVKEKVTTAYGKFGLDFKAGIPVHGNLGLQVVRADQHSSGVIWDPVANQAVTGKSYGKSYTDVLPSLNLTGELTPSTYVRFGAAKTLARPNLDDMRSGFAAQINPPSSGASAGQWSGSGGNPFLEPWRATALDLSVEKYFGKRSYVGLAAFHKRLETSIYVDSTNFDFTGFPNSTPGSVVCMVRQTNCNIGVLSAPVNGQGGYIEGVEFTTALDFALLAKSLDGFGTMFSFSHNHSNLPGTDKYGQANPNTTLEGLSGDVASITAYYERNGWSARIGQRYRSRYVATVRGVWIDNSLAAIESERITDLQLGYAWESGPYKGLSVQFQINNLTDTPYRTTLNDDSYTQLTGNNLMMPERYTTYGRRYLLGLSYKM